MRQFKVAIVFLVLLISLSSCNFIVARSNAVSSDSTAQLITNSSPSKHEKEGSLFESESFKIVLSFCAVAVAIVSLLIAAILFGYKLNGIIRKVSNLREEKNKELDAVQDILENIVEDQVYLADSIYNQILRTLMQTEKYTQQKADLQERYKKLMTELEFTRFISYLSRDDVHQIDVGIKGLDGLGDPRAIPELDKFIAERNNKKDFSELVERAKSVRNRIVHLNR